MSFFVAALAVYLLNTYGCLKDDSLFSDEDSYLSINDSLVFLQRITGEWVWDSTIGLNGKSNFYAGFIYVLNFKPNQSVLVFKNGKMLKQTRWEIVREGDQLNLATDSAIDFVRGQILFNQNKMRYLDTNGIGFEYYFSKKL